MKIQREVIQGYIADFLARKLANDSASRLEKQIVFISLIITLNKLKVLDVESDSTLYSYFAAIAANIRHAP